MMKDKKRISKTNNRVVHGKTPEERFKERHGITIEEWNEQQFNAKTGMTPDEWYINEAKSTTHFMTHENIYVFRHVIKYAF